MSAIELVLVLCLMVQAGGAFVLFSQRCIAIEMAGLDATRFSWWHRFGVACGRYFSFIGLLVGLGVCTIDGAFRLCRWATGRPQLVLVADEAAATWVSLVCICGTLMAASSYYDSSRVAFFMSSEATRRVAEIERDLQRCFRDQTGARGE